MCSKQFYLSPDGRLFKNVVFKQPLFILLIFIFLILQNALNAKVFGDILPGTFIPNAENIYCNLENAPALPTIIFESEKSALCIPAGKPSITPPIATP